ncbi:hypothetical protein Avbf_16964 [Armadillidium vulgare]|nr:hypothetical protein Avbf_16964 [Armadillidium vulgare]
MSFCRNANMAPVMKVGRYVKYVHQSFIVWFRAYGQKINLTEHKLSQDLLYYNNNIKHDISKPRKNTIFKKIRLIAYESNQTTFNFTEEEITDVANKGCGNPIAKLKIPEDYQFFAPFDIVNYCYNLEKK